MLDIKVCSICGKNDQVEEQTVQWIAPCYCKSAISWFHTKCFLPVLSHYASYKNSSLNCWRCDTAYKIVLPSIGPFGYTLLKTHNFYRSLMSCCNVSYILGHQIILYTGFGLVLTPLFMDFGYLKKMLLNADSDLVLLLTPLVPLSFIAARLVSWESWLSRAWGSCLKRWRSDPEDDDDDDDDDSTVDYQDVLYFRHSNMRSELGGLLLPLLARLTGHVLFGKVPSTLRRFAYGCGTFVFVKGCLRMYLKSKVCQSLNSYNFYDKLTHPGAAEAA